VPDADSEEKTALIGLAEMMASARKRRQSHVLNCHNCVGGCRRVPLVVEYEAVLDVKRGMDNDKDPLPALRQRPPELQRRTTRSLSRRYAARPTTRQWTVSTHQKPSRRCASRAQSCSPPARTTSPKTPPTRKPSRPAASRAGDPAKGGGSASHMRHFGTRPGGGRRGVGRSIAVRCEVEARSADVPVLQVYSRLRAEAFYARCGFARRGGRLLRLVGRRSRLILWRSCWRDRPLAQPFPPRPPDSAQRSGDKT
jgi:hypothetical protein